MLYGRLRLKSIEIIRDAINVKVNEGFLAFGAQEEVAVFVVVHEEVFGEGGGVEGDGEGIGPGASTGGVGAPAAGGEPAVAGTGGVAVDGDEDDVLAAQLSAPFVYTAAALWQGDVRFLGHQEDGVQAPGGECVHNAPGDDAVFAVFQQAAVGRTLAPRLGSVAIVDEDLHS